MKKKKMTLRLVRIYLNNIKNKNSAMDSNDISSYEAWFSGIFTYSYILGVVILVFKIH